MKKFGLYLAVLMVFTVAVDAQNTKTNGNRRWVRQMPSESYIWIDNNDCETNVRTVITKHLKGFPSVGGTLQAWENVTQKYLVVSNRITKMNVLGDTKLTEIGKPYEGTTPFEYCVINCNDLSVEEFKAVDISFLPLDPNKEYFARPCVVYKNGFPEYGRVREIIYNK